MQVARRLENMIRSKLSRSDLDTGGRQIEIKLITATTLVDDEDLDDASEALRGMVTPSSEAAADAEAQQFQSMIYNLMVKFCITLNPFRKCLSALCLLDWQPRGVRGDRQPEEDREELQIHLGRRRGQGGEENFQ